MTNDGFPILLGLSTPNFMVTSIAATKLRGSLEPPKACIEEVVSASTAVVATNTHWRLQRSFGYHFSYLALDWDE